MSWESYTKEASVSGNSPELTASSALSAVHSSLQGGVSSHFQADDLRRIGMREGDVQALMHKIAAARADTDGGESGADSLSETLPTTPPKTPGLESGLAMGPGSTKTSQDTGATMPLSTTTESHGGGIPIERRL